MAIWRSTERCRNAPARYAITRYAARMRRCVAVYAARCCRLAYVSAGQAVSARAAKYVQAAPENAAVQNGCGKARVKCAARVSEEFARRRHVYKQAT